MQGTATDKSRMTLSEAERLLRLSREVQWTFPTSGGRPVHWDKPDAWVEKLSSERGSFADAAMFLVAKGREDDAIEIAANVWRLWVLEKDDAGGRKFLCEILDGSPEKSTRHRALALYGDSLLAFRMGRIDESRTRSLEALRIATAVKDPEALVLANLASSRVSMEEGQYEAARSSASQARRWAHNLRLAYTQAPLFMEAMSNRVLRDYDRAAKFCSENLELNRKIGDRGMVFAELNNLSFIEIHRNNVDVAEQLFAESERMADGKHEDPYGRGMMYLNKAAISYLRGRIPEARSLLHTARSTFEEAKIDPAKDDMSEFDWLDQQLSKARELER